jgi:hypothetical protein
MNIGIIDADLIERKNHRFPNLCCMKISGYHKSIGNNVKLELDYNKLETFDKVYVAKVFTNTPITESIFKNKNIIFGGTGFYYDKAAPLIDLIEHHKPDYNLYKDWLIDAEGNTEYYKDYSIGFLTRHCFRGCYFCVNKNYKKVDFNAPLSEFYDDSKKYICLLDDNFLGYRDWKIELDSLIKTKKYFQFKQGLDIRLMTEEKAEILSNVKYKGDYIFAFDNINDKELIMKNLELWRKYCLKTTKLYVFCGYEDCVQDIVDTFERIKILMQFGCLPYIMRHENYENSRFRGIYIDLARWCNQPSFYKKKSFKEFCISNGETSSACKYMIEFEKEYPQIAKQYFDLKFENIHERRI